MNTSSGFRGLSQLDEPAGANEICRYTISAPASTALAACSHPSAALSRPHHLRECRFRVIRADFEVCTAGPVGVISTVEDDIATGIVHAGPAIRLARNTAICDQDVGYTSMRVFRAVAMIALLSAPAFAPAPVLAQDHMQQAGEKDPEKTRQEIEADKEAQKAYQRSLGNIPDRGTSDPWGNVRSDSAPKAVAKAPAKRTKTGTTAH